ncbi:MAG: transglutaminase family protein [Puniceicoccales bacterium]|jgi:transglutaminase-like putative cysteine protease|nr:transglutaminase family protein [Puniceicoccales bacterium]
MRLHVLHRTAYVYGSPVRESFNEVRLHPASLNGQVCEHFLLKVLPATRLTHFRDFYLNYVHLFEITESHTHLSVEATSVVTTGNDHLLSDDQRTTPLADMERCTRIDQCYDFMQASHYVDISPETWRIGLDIATGEGLTDAWQIARAVMRYIHGNFVYMPAATNSHTHMHEVLKSRCGVCQDFAHVMLGICRALKIPARYVSGYIFNGPADQLRGAQASHAWVEVYLPDFGWRGLDPTNNAQPDERYVKLAVGRDFADVSPVKGTYRGTGEHKLVVEVVVSDLNQFSGMI